MTCCNRRVVVIVCVVCVVIVCVVIVCVVIVCVVVVAICCCNWWIIVCILRSLCATNESATEKRKCGNSDDCSSHNFKF